MAASKSDHPAGLGVAWARPATWFRLLIATIYAAAIIGAAPPLVSRWISDQFSLIGDPLVLPSMIATGVLVLALFIVTRLGFGPIAIGKPAEVFAPATRREGLLVLLWIVAVAVLIAFIGKWTHHIVTTSAGDIPLSVMMVTPILAIIAFQMLADALLSWLRKTSP